MPLNRPITDWNGVRVWLVGASSGIGAALARALAVRGARMALSARDPVRLAVVAHDCHGALALPMDVTREGDYARVLADIVGAWGGVDVVVFNAGTYAPLRGWEMTPAAVRQTLEVNLLGVMNGAATVIPTLLAQGKGAISIVGSVAGYGGLPKAIAYGASKAALINFSETLYLDLAPRGVSVFLVSPGFVATPLTQQNDFHMPALIQPEAAAAAIIDGFARGRFEIDFPKRFTRVLRLMRLLPYRLYFALVRKVTGT